MRCECPDRRVGNPEHAPHECEGWPYKIVTRNGVRMAVCHDCVLSGDTDIEPAPTREEVRCTPSLSS